MSRALVLVVLFCTAADAARAVEPFGRPVPERARYWSAEARAAEARREWATAARFYARVCHYELSSLGPTSRACDLSLELAREARDVEAEAYALASRGNGRLWAGKYEQGRDDLEAALRIAPEVSPARALAELTRAGQLLEGGDFDRALTGLSRAVDVARAAGDVEQEGWAEIWRARVLALLGAEGAAVEAGVRGLVLAAEQGDPSAAAWARLMIGLAHLEVGHFAAALEPSRRGLAEARSVEAWVAAWLLETHLAEALVGLGRLEEAESHLAFLEAAVDRGHAPPPYAAAVRELRARATLAAGRPAEAVGQFARAADASLVSWLGERSRLGLARARAAVGDGAEAVAAYRAAVAAIEQARAGARLEELRVHFLTTRADAYRELAWWLVAAGKAGAVEEAFGVAEAGRARALEDARAGAESAETNAASARTDVSFERLGAERALVEYVTTRAGTMAFLVTAAGAPGIEVVALPGAGELARLTERVDFYRRAVREARTAETLAAAGRRLYADLVAPWVARLPRGVEAITVVPDGPLHALPFAALVSSAEGERLEFLVERFDLQMAPSAALAMAPARAALHVGAAAEGLVVSFDGGASDASTRGGAGPLPRLRFASDEGRRVGQRLGRALGSEVTRLDGDGATETALGALALERFAVVHFAVHGVVSEAVPSRSALRLASGALAAAPDDGWLTAQEIAALALSPALVVLSACHSGAGLIAGGEGPLSLARAFLAAGASTVAATLWELDDRGAVELVERFYRELGRGRSAEAALAAAQRAAIARGDRPAVWAAFALWGSPELRLPIDRSEGESLWLAGLAVVGLLAFTLYVRRRS